MFQLPLNEDVMVKHEEYQKALDDYANEKITYLFIDLHEELDNIEQNLDTEASKILLCWIRDAIDRVSDTYKS
jgi:hypothetical protein